MTEKKAMFVQVKMDKQMSTEAWRERFCEVYDVFKAMPGVFSKCFWVNQEQGIWGSFYVFNSEEDLKNLLNSPVWANIPKAPGTEPQIMIVDPGPILYKEAVTTAKDSWLTK